MSASANMIGAVLLAAAAMPLRAEISGVVMNSSTNRPQSGVTVTLVHPGEQGMQTLGTAKSDEQGRFQINKEVPSPPALLQAVYQGANYNLVLAPGAPSTGVQVSVFETTTKASANKLSQHMIVLEPTVDKLRVSEMFLLENDSNETFSDAAKGSVQVYVPGEAPTDLQASIEAPGGMPIRRPLEKTDKPGVFKLNYPVKPGESRFEVSYTLPASDSFSGRRLRTDGPTRLVTAGTVKLSGDALKDLGQEPQTQAHIWEVTAPAFEAKIDGIGAIRSDANAGNQKGEDDGSPQIEVVNARLYTKLLWVLGLAFSILGLGGFLLYRKGAA